MALTFLALAQVNCAGNHALAFVRIDSCVPVPPQHILKMYSGYGIELSIIQTCILNECELSVCVSAALSPRKSPEAGRHVMAKVKITCPAESLTPTVRS